MASNQTYSQILERISYSPKEVLEIQNTKKKLVELIDSSFSTLSTYKGFKFIGSAASGNSLKWKKDIDGIIILNPYEKDSFRKRIFALEPELTGLKFTDKCNLVRDHFSGSYNQFDLGIGAVNESADPKTSLEGDIKMHSDFVSSHLIEKQKDDVLLTKLFFYNSGIYGKIIGGGFSIEQLVAYFGSFDEILTNFSKGEEIVVDFSGKYKGKKSPLIITYPYCGLENMCSNVGLKEYDQLVNYAHRIVNDPEQFLEDSLVTFNQEFWKKRAKRFGNTEEFSFPDIHLNKRENETIRNIVKKFKPSKILDLGCGNGYSAVEINRGLESHLIGLDSNDQVIKFANQLALIDKRMNATFEVGRMEDLSFPKNSFDMIYAKRALSNLPTRRLQGKSIEECARVLNSNGILCISDLFLEGYDKINHVREKVGLPRINIPNHACLFSEKDLLQLTKNHFNLQEICDSTSTYYFISRVIYPFLAKIIGAKVISSSKINWLASNLPSPGFLGLNKVYTFKKNE